MTVTDPLYCGVIIRVSYLKVEATVFPSSRYWKSVRLQTIAGEINLKSRQLWVNFDRENRRDPRSRGQIGQKPDVISAFAPRLAPQQLRSITSVHWPPQSRAVHKHTAVRTPRIRVDLADMTRQKAHSRMQSRAAYLGSTYTASGMRVRWFRLGVVSRRMTCPR
jgi:hypothetical protein